MRSFPLIGRRPVTGALATLGALTALGSVATGVAVSRTARAAASPACQTAGLVIWLDTQSSGAAGSSYYTLNFTNLSGHTCTLRGYPGVSAVGLTGHQIGAAARRNSAFATKTVTLTPGKRAFTLVQIVDDGVYPAATCQPATAAGLRVFPPNQTASKIVPYPFSTCSSSAEKSLSVMTVRK
jgi:hypothetical protein